MRGLTVAWIKRKLKKSGVVILHERQFQQGTNGKMLSMYMVDVAFDSDYDGNQIVHTEIGYSEKAVYKKLYAKYKELQSNVNTQNQDDAAYEIPDNIKELFTDGFFTALKEECEKIFGGDLFHKDEFGIAQIDCLAGTGGFYTAFSNACNKSNSKNLLDYWTQLEWYDSDLLEAEICENLSERFG